MLGAGKRLFAEGAIPAALKPIDHKTTSTGVSIDAYTPNGEPGLRGVRARARRA